MQLRRGVLGIAAGVLLLAPRAGASADAEKSIDLLLGVIRPAGEFKPPQKCTPEGDGVRLTITGRQPGEWGGCCVQLRTPVTFTDVSRPAFEIELASSEELVNIKLESGAFGKPDRTAWLYRGPMSKGAHKFRAYLSDDNYAPIKAMAALRMCFAIVGKVGPAANELTVNRAVLGPDGT